MHAKDTGGCGENIDMCCHETTKSDATLQMFYMAFCAEDHAKVASQSSWLC